MNYKRFFIVLFFVIIFIYMVAINSYVPLLGDDWLRLSHSSIKDVLHFVYYIYLHWSGRIVTYFLSSFFPLNNKFNISFFNILNSLFFVVLIDCIFLLAYSRFPKNLSDLIILSLILSAMWFIPISLGEVIFWKAGSSVYLWSITMTLMFVYPYKRLLEGQNQISDNLISRMAFFIIGALLATGLENLSLTFCVIFISVLYYRRIKKRNITGWAYTGICGYILGTIVLMVAPGNYARLRVSHVISYFHPSLLQKTFLFSGQIVVHFLPFAILYLAIFILRYKFKQKTSYRELGVFYFFLVISLLSAVIMWGAPGALFYGRVTFVSDIFAVIAMVSLIPIDGKNLLRKIFLLFTILIALPLQIFDMLETYKFYRQLHDQVVQREGLIKAMAQHNKNLSVAPIYFSRQLNTFNLSGEINNYRFFASDITPDSTRGGSLSARMYYNLDSIKLIPDLLFNDTLPIIKTATKLPFIITLQDNKIYYINLTSSCDNLKNKKDILLRVYPKRWQDNKFYAINQIFSLQDNRQKIKDLLTAHKSPMYFLNPKIWINWHEMFSNFNDLSFTWSEAKRAMIITRDFQPVNNVCVIVDYLPHYLIDHIETGQVKNIKQPWRTVLQPVKSVQNNNKSR